jgi:hypothetical protein
VTAIAAAITKKSARDVAGFDEVWLLVSCGVPEHGAVVSTFVMTNWLSVETLTTATLPALSRSCYARAFLHPIVTLEDVFYEWTPTQPWQKHIRARSGTAGLSFWDLQREIQKRVT